MITTFDTVPAPYGGANFLAARENPVKSDRVNNIEFRLAEHDWQWQLNKLRSLKYRASILGHQGSGKTTLLYALAELLNRRSIANHHVSLPPQTTHHGALVQHAITRSENGAILLVDGIERLSFMSRWQLFRQTRRGAGLVVTAHRSCSLPTWIHCKTSPELMVSILEDLGLGDHRIRIAALRAFENSSGNVRNALRDLYDQFAAGRFNDILSR